MTVIGPFAGSLAASIYSSLGFLQVIMFCDLVNVKVVIKRMIAANI